MRLQIDGRNVYAYTGGRPFDPATAAVVFLHGAQLDHSVWIMQSRAIAHQGLSVLAFDLPGHGRSDGAPLTSIEAMADWLAHALETVGATDATLVGHSMGSLIALDCAARHPRRIAGLSLIGCAFPMQVSDALLDAARSDEQRAFAMINRWSHWNTDNAPAAPGPGFSIWHQNLRLMQRQKTGVLLNDFQACNAYQAGFERADALARPVQFILGARDMMTPPRAAQPLIDRCEKALQSRGLPAPDVVQIPECGHALMAERPLAVLTALRQFLAARPRMAQAG